MIKTIGKKRVLWFIQSIVYSNLFRLYPYFGRIFELDSNAKELYNIRFIKSNCHKGKEVSK